MATGKFALFREWTGSRAMTEAAKVKPHEKPAKSRDQKLDQALNDTFPASDPPSMTQPSVKIGAPARQPKRGKV
jgi:hypothetical protein